MKKAISLFALILVMLFNSVPAFAIGSSAHASADTSSAHDSASETTASEASTISESSQSVSNEVTSSTSSIESRSFQESQASIMNEVEKEGNEINRSVFSGHTFNDINTPKNHYYGFTDYYYPYWFLWSCSGRYNYYHHLNKQQQEYLKFVGFNVKKYDFNKKRYWITIESDGKKLVQVTKKQYDSIAKGNKVQVINGKLELLLSSN